MNDQPSYESMSLEEFIKQPYIVQLHAKNEPYFKNKIKEVPYIKEGKTVRGDFTVIHADSRKFYDLIDILGTTTVDLFPEALALLGRESLESAAVTQVHRQPYLDLRGRGTLVGIIDTGIDYTKTAFQYEDGTSKIRFLWDQSIEGNSPGDFLLGSEFTNEQINTALQADNPYDYVPSADTAGHGTFLASIAASRQDSEFIGAAPDADLLVVKLRRMQQGLSDEYLIPRSQENVFSGVDVMLAIDYMIDKATELGMPLSICLGVGSHMSGHNGYAVLGRYLRNISQMTGICVCAAAGNESNTGHHTSGKLSGTDSTADIQIRIPENANGFILHLFTNSPDRMSVSLRSPLGETVPRAAAITGSVTETQLVLEKARIRVVHYLPIAGLGVQLIIIYFFNPTPGIWNVTMHGDVVVDGSFNAWLPITGLGTPGIRFLTPSPNMTIAVPATSPGCITCGAHNSRDNSLYIHSSWGPTRSMLQKPDLTAPGVNVSGIYPLGSGQMTGTSVAAAITAGACALMLQWGIVNENDISLDTNSIKSLLTRGCQRDADIQYPNWQWGYGKLDLLNTFRNIRGEF